MNYAVNYVNYCCNTDRLNSKPDTVKQYAYTSEFKSAIVRKPGIAAGRMFDQMTTVLHCSCHRPKCLECLAATGEPTHKTIRNPFIRHWIFHLRCKFHSSIPNSCQDFANLGLLDFNLSQSSRYELSQFKPDKCRPTY